MLAIYTRLSVEEKDSNSIANQKREGKIFADKKSLKYKNYDEGEGVSGGLDIEDRPVFSALIEDIIKGEITSVWVRDQKRLERNQYTFHYFVNLVLKKNISFYIGDKLTDFKDTNTYIQTSMDSVFNTKKRIEQSDSTKRSLLLNAKEGKFQGITSYGYMKDEKTKVVVINPDEEDVVKLIYKLSLQGLGQSRIANELNRLKKPTRYNKYGEGKGEGKNKGTFIKKDKLTKEKTIRNKADVKWSSNTVRNILINTSYKGEKKYLDDIFPIKPIFSKEYWDEVNQNLKNNRINSGNKSNVYNYLLKGLIKCGRCGRNYYGVTKLKRENHSYYMCSSKRIKGESCGNRSIKIKFLENFIWDRIILDDKHLNEIIDHFKNTDEEKLSLQLLEDLKKLKSNKKSLEKQKANTVTNLNKEILEPDEAEKDLTRIRRELTQLENQILSTKSNLEFYQNKEESVDEITYDLRHIQKNTSYEQKLHLINKYIKNVKISFSDDDRKFLIEIKFTSIIQFNNYLVDDRYKGVEEDSKYMFDYFKEIGFDIFADDDNPNID